MKRAATIWVRNNGKEPFVDRYDGEDFTIEPGGAIEMSNECATLCLGFGEEDKTRALRRKGWVFLRNAMSEGETRLDAFSFHMSESEARAFGKRSKTDRSAAPAGAEAAEAGAPPVSAATVTGAGRPGPLEKLAAAAAG